MSRLSEMLKVPQRLLVRVCSTIESAATYYEAPRRVISSVKHTPSEDALGTHVGSDQTPPDRHVQTIKARQALHVPHPQAHLIGDDLERVQLAIQLIIHRRRIDLAVRAHRHGSGRRESDEDEERELRVTGDHFVGRVGRERLRLDRPRRSHQPAAMN